MVPKTQTKTKIQRNRRSITMATYFQSSLTWTGDKGGPGISHMMPDRSGMDISRSHLSHTHTHHCSLSRIPE